MPGATAVLAAWERAAGRPGVARGAAVLDMLDRPLTEVAAAATARLGEVVEGVLDCTGCGGLLEVRAEVPAPVGGGPVRAGARFVVRSPTPRDVAAAAVAGNRAREVLLRRCAAWAGGAAVEPADLSAADLAQIDEALEDVAGEAYPVLRTECPECGAVVSGVVDMPEMLWRRVEAEAAAVLRDVARLAGAFGWREADVLGMSPARRAAYLELAG